MAKNSKGITAAQNMKNWVDLTGVVQKKHQNKLKNGKYPRMGFPEWNFDSAVGHSHPMGTDAGSGNGGFAGGASLTAGFAPSAVATSSGPVAAAPCGESIEPSDFNAILEHFKAENPTSAVVDKIKDMFNASQDGNLTPLIHDSEGVDTVADMENRPTDDTQTSALAAACEAVLYAFKAYTGVDYFNYRK